MLVSVVIVNWNARDDLVRCLRSLEEDPPPGDWEVVIVDNGSTDGSLDAASAVLPGVRTIVNPGNRGLAAGNNQGIAATTGDYVLISNPDVIYSGGAIAEMCAVLERHPRAAIAVPQLLRPNGQRQTSAGSLPTLREAALGGLRRRRRADVMSGYWWHAWAHDEERPIGHGAEAAYLVRRAAIEDVGPQDERFSLDWEGIDWSARMGQRDWEIWFAPGAVVEHVGGASIRQAQLRWVTASSFAMYCYFSARRPRWQGPFLAALFGARAILKAGVIKVGFPVYELAERRKRIDPASTTAR
jgi:GT2 family glycosyltransferase